MFCQESCNHLKKKNDLKYFILILKFNKTYIYIYIELHKYDMMYVIYKI